jgi:hypothetical protein
MADKGHPTATEMDYPAHERNYSGFIALFKWGAVASALITLAVVLMIAS